MRTCALLVLLTTLGALAQAAEPQAGVPPDPALVDAIVRKLDSDGTLDRAVERAITRVIQRQEEARRSTEAQRQAQSQERAKAARKVNSGRDHIRGEAGAEVSLIEYSDFECPFCKRFHGTPTSLMGRYAGRINWVYRHYPLDFHNPAAHREAIASECAAQVGGKEAFWQYADAVFNQTQSDGKGLPADDSVEVIAVRLGMNRARFMRCLEDPASAKRVDEDLADGAAVGISGTPTTLIRNNRTGVTEMIVGAQPPEALIAAVERVLAAAR
jgi:protein-disulfide isomerase